MSPDDDGKRVLRIVPAQPKPPPRTPAAAAAARYRARKRGEPVAKRKPGPKPSTITELRMQIRELESRIRELEGLQRIAAAQLGRRYGAATVEEVGRELLRVLSRWSPERDSDEDRVLLGDLTAAIEARHEYSPE